MEEVLRGKRVESCPLLALLADFLWHFWMPSTLGLFVILLSSVSHPNEKYLEVLGLVSNNVVKFH